MTSNNGNMTPVNPPNGGRSVEVRNPFGGTVRVSSAAAQALNTPAPALDTLPPGTRFIISFDATASRSDTWEAATEIQAGLVALLKKAQSNTASVQGPTANNSAPAAQLSWWKKPLALLTNRTSRTNNNVVVAETKPQHVQTVDTPPHNVKGFNPVIRLSHFGGDHFQVHAWTDNLSRVSAEMADVSCVRGQTQIGDVLRDAVAQAAKGQIAAVIFTGDSMEEQPQVLCALAHQLAQHKVPVYMFQEGANNAAKTTFKAIAAITGGAHLPFKTGSFKVLEALFHAVIARHSNDADLMQAARNNPALPSAARKLLLLENNR